MMIADEVTIFLFDAQTYLVGDTRWDGERGLPYKQHHDEHPSVRKRVPRKRQHIIFMMNQHQIEREFLIK